MSLVKYSQGLDGFEEWVGTRQTGYLRPSPTKYSNTYVVYMYIYI